MNDSSVGNNPRRFRVLEVNRRIRIPLDELRFSYVRASGPGGQNVNKLATKAVLRWRVGDSQAFPDDVCRRFVDRHSGRISSTGDFVISSQRFRTQRRNQRDCLEKLANLILAVAEPPTERRPVKPTAASRRKRRVDKQARSRKKESRRSSEWNQE